MKTRNKIVILFWVIFLLPMELLFAAATGASTQGSEFYFSFIRALSGRKPNMELVVSSEKAGVLRFTCKDTDGITPKVSYAEFNSGTTKISLATFNGSDVDASSPFPNCYTYEANTVTNRGYVVEAFESDGAGGVDESKPLKVSIYAGLAGKSTMDMSNIYPYEALGNEYFVMAREGSSGDDSHSEALVMATEDNTEIEIYPTCLLEGQSATDLLTPVKITLNRGQTYQIRAHSADAGAIGKTDLTGTIIRTKQDDVNKCKRIAVFAGTQHSKPGDFEYDQMFPTHLWGNEFLVVPTEDNAVPIIRIGASRPCTEVKINGQYVTTLNQTDFYQYEDTNREGILVEASQPIQVALFTYKRSGSEDNDASMVVLAPVRQMLNTIMFTPSDNPGSCDYHRVAITTPKGNGTNVKFYELISGSWSEIAISSWNPTISDKYETATMPLNATSSYKLETSTEGFNAFVYGWGPDKSEYSYSVGSSAVPVESGFNLNSSGNEYSDKELNRGICVGTIVDLTPTIPAGSSVGYVEWTVTKIAQNGEPAEEIKSGKFTEPPYKMDVKFTEVDKIYTTRMVMQLQSSDCFVSETGKIEVEAEYTVTQNKHIEDVVRMVCKGTPIVATIEALKGAEQPKYIWREMFVNGIDTTFTDVIPSLTTDQLPTADMEEGTTRLYRLEAFNNVGAICDVYLRDVSVSIPVSVAPTLEIEGIGKELKLCNDGSFGTATLIGKVNKNKEVDDPRFKIIEELVSSDRGVVGENSYSFVPDRTETYTYTVTVEDEDKNVCKPSPLSDNVTVQAFPDFSARLVSESPDFITPNKLPASGGNVTFTV
ncbi:MAG: IgGFc-binding protein, partial [Bacteroidales bacterium]|nr:IgGFc-binding protein [Bacteroidales bacterium]